MRLCRMNVEQVRDQSILLAVTLDQYLSFQAFVWFEHYFTCFQSTMFQPVYLACPSGPSLSVVPKCRLRFLLFMFQAGGTAPCVDIFNMNFLIRMFDGKYLLFINSFLKDLFYCLYHFTSLFPACIESLFS